MSHSQLLTPERLAGSSNDYAPVRIDQLRVGARLRMPIYENRTDRNLLLISGGTTITSSLLERLKQRGITTVRIHRGELQETAPAPRVPALATKAAAKEAVPSADARFLQRISDRSSTSYDANLTRRVVETHEQSVEQIDALLDGVSHGDLSNGNAVVSISNESLFQMTADLDLFVSLGLEPATDTYPGRHSLQVAKLSMAIGAVMGLKPSDLIEMAIGCLVHDVGMLTLKRELFECDAKLSSIQFLEITKHPTLTFELVKDLKQLSTGSRMVAYQMHERWNGTGYPRRRQGRNIHSLARIAGAADMFVALVSPRPHRPGLLPYRAMEQMLNATRRGDFDPKVMRALLCTTSLFPIGSFVELTDGRICKVVRSNRENYARPVVELCLPGGQGQGPQIVDLASEPAVEVSRCVPPVAASQELVLPDHWD